jgi:hypothetical protein
MEGTGKKRTGERTSRARSIIRSVLRFTPGQGHYVPCVDEADQERMRVCLMTERKRLEFEDADVMTKVRISKQMLETDRGDIFVVKVHRAEDFGEDLITFDREGNISVERILPDYDPLVMSQIEDAFNSGLAIEEIEKVGESGEYVYFKIFNPKDVEIAIKHMKKKLNKDAQSMI